jgi:hypothetical protein
MIDIWPEQYFARLLNVIFRIGKAIAMISAIIVFILLKSEILFRYPISLLKTYSENLDSLDWSTTYGPNVYLGIIEGIAYVNAIFPVSEFVILYVSYVSGWVVICLIRWVKSFIPTIAN